MKHIANINPTYESTVAATFFSDKVVWVTGASSGIGEAVAIDLCKVIRSHIRSKQHVFRSYPKMRISAGRGSSCLRAVRISSRPFRYSNYLRNIPSSVYSMLLCPRASTVVTVPLPWKVCGGGTSARSLGLRIPCSGTLPHLATTT